MSGVPFPAALTAELAPGNLFPCEEVWQKHSYTWSFSATRYVASVGSRTLALSVTQPAAWVASFCKKDVAL